MPAAAATPGPRRDDRVARPGDAPGDVSALFDETGDGSVVVRVHAQPGARRDQIVGRHGDALKVAVRAAAERGRANQAIEQLVAAAFGVRPASVLLVGGATGRAKRVRVAGVDGVTATAVLARLLAATEPVGYRSGDGSTGGPDGG